MGSEKLKAYNLIVRSMGQILALSRLYNQEHPVVKIKSAEVFNQLTALITEKDSLVFAESPEATLLVNGEEVKGENSLMKRFIKDFRNLKLGSLDLRYGITAEELSIFIDLLNNQQQLTGDYQIKDYLKKRGAVHLEPSFAAYKLINENEIIVKENEVVQVSDIPAEKINSFIEDLCLGQLDKKTFKQDKDYDFLAHNLSFLFKIITDESKYNNTPENFTKTLWAIGDYLIGEIDSLRQEEINRKIISELQEKLIAYPGDKKITPDEINKSLAAINAALQLKGLLLLYKKHKKGIKDSEKKINRILDELPKNSQLYIKTKQELSELSD